MRLNNGTSYETNTLLFYEAQQEGHVQCLLNSNSFMTIYIQCFYTALQMSAVLYIIIVGQYK